MFSSRFASVIFEFENRCVMVSRESPQVKRLSILSLVNKEVVPHDQFTAIAIDKERDY